MYFFTVIVPALPAGCLCVLIMTLVTEEAKQLKRHYMEGTQPAPPPQRILEDR